MLDLNGLWLAKSEVQVDRRHTVSSKVVGASALVTSSRTRTTSKSTSWRKPTLESSSRSTNTTASTWDWAWTSGIGARALITTSVFIPQFYQHHIQPNVQVDHNYSIFHLYQPRSDVELGSRLEHGQVPGSDSIA